MESKKIDFVISWVDGNNEEWQDLRKQYKKEETGSDARKEDTGIGIIYIFFLEELRNMLIG